jgi:hypothetical protein
MMMKKVALIFSSLALCLVLGCASKEIPEDQAPLPIPDKPPMGMGAGPQSGPEKSEPAPSKKMDG